MFYDYSFIIAALIVSILYSRNCVAAFEDTSTNDIDLLLEYKKALSEDEFNTMLKIYTNETIAPIEKEKLVVNFFSSLPKRVISRLPVPMPFRSLPQNIQQKIKSIYYSNEISYKEKLVQIRKFAQKLVSKLLAEQNNGNGGDEESSDNLVEFQVNISLKLNGFYSKEALRDSLRHEQRQQLDKILNDNTIDYQTKTIEIGRLLRRLYQNPENLIREWPTLHGTENYSHAAKTLITQLLFGNDSAIDLRHFLELYKPHISDTKNENNERILRPRRYITTVY